MLSESDCAIRYKVFGLTHPGTVRSENEDVIDWWYDPQCALTFALVADGMGGHDGGAEASRIAADTIRRRISSLVRGFTGDIEVLKKLMISALKDANTAICRASEAHDERKKMGTTIVFAAVFNDRLVVLHVGDSRCYLLHPKTGEQSQLTRDDSVVQAMLDEGVITKEDVPNVPYRNRLTNALGMQHALEYSLNEHIVDQNALVLLCSDGFYHVVELDEVCALLRDKGCTQEVSQSLLEISLNNHTNDNTSLVLIAADIDTNRVQELYT